MVEEWQLVRLGEVATTSQGGTPRKNEADYWNGQIPFLTGADLTEFRLSRKHARSFLTAEGLHSGQTVVCEPGALLLATRTRVGLAGLTTEIMGASQDITRLTPSDEVHSGYLCRYLLSVAASLQRKSRGTTIQGITKDELQSIAIPLPPLPEQRAIANILDSIDHAIEAADALVSSTEQLRDSLLHNLLTRGLPGRHTEWKQVPGLGTIPADWETSQLGDLAEIAFSGVDKKTVAGEDPVSLCNYTDVFYNRRIRPEMAFMSATAMPIERERWNLQKGDVLFTKDSETPDEIGIPAYVTDTMPEVLCGYHLGLARPKPDLADGAFLSEAMASPMMSKQFARIANGVTRFGLTLNATNSLQLPLPSLPEQQAIAAILESVDESIEKGRGAGEGLRKLKESASDALLTGRVRVSP